VFEEDLALCRLGWGDRNHEAMCGSGVTGIQEIGWFREVSYKGLIQRQGRSRATYYRR
jgi:hypothetical protein